MCAISSLLHDQKVVVDTVETSVVVADTFAGNPVQVRTLVVESAAAACLRIPAGPGSNSVDSADHA